MFLIFKIIFLLFIINFSSYANECSKLLTEKDIIIHKIKESVIGFELKVSHKFLNLYELGKIPLIFPKNLHNYVIFGDLDWNYILDNDYVDYDELRNILIEKNINNEEFYNNFVKIHEKINGKRIPRHPHVLYRKYWIGRDFFFGEIILSKNNGFLSLKEALDYCKSIFRFFDEVSLKDKLKFLIRQRILVKKDGTPLNEDYLDKVLKKEEYFLETMDKPLPSWSFKKERKKSNIEYVSYNEAQNYVIKLNLKTLSAYREYVKSGKMPENIPRYPDKEYKNKGWETWGIFLGTGNVSVRNRTFLSFGKARDYVSQLGLKNQKEWNAYSKSGKRPKNIPSDPSGVYKYDWQGLSYFLGKTNKKKSK